jgi:hypothetical protein
MLGLTAGLLVLLVWARALAAVNMRAPVRRDITSSQ